MREHSRLAIGRGIEIEAKNFNLRCTIRSNARCSSGLFMDRKVEIGKPRGRIIDLAIE